MKILKILGIIFLVIIILFVILYFSTVGVTKKQKYYNCVENCEEMMIHESSKRYCGPKCEEVVGYFPTAAGKKAVATKTTKNTSSKPKPKTNTNTNANKNVNISNRVDQATRIPILEPIEEGAEKDISVLQEEGREFYCNWVWPQEIIDIGTKELIVECPMSSPWCYYADFKYENVGCCKDRAHKDCILLDELLK